MVAKYEQANPKTRQAGDRRATFRPEDTRLIGEALAPATTDGRAYSPRFVRGE